MRTITRSRDRHRCITALAVVVPLILAACGNDQGATAADTTSPTRGEPLTTTARPTTTTTSVVALTFSYHQSAPVTGTPVCEPPGSCVIPFSLTGSNTGDLEGTFAQAGAAAVLPDRTIHAYGTVVFTGIVAGCGTGTLVFGSTGINRSGATSGGVEILAGTGDLEGMTGTGTIVSGAGEPSGEGTGTIEMQVTCS